MLYSQKVPRLSYKTRSHNHLSFTQINQLINRVKNSQFKEIILATDPTSDGEFTAQYIHEKIKPYCLLITRIAIGVPIGSEVNYIDKNTLAKSIVDRRKIG